MRYLSRFVGISLFAAFLVAFLLTSKPAATQSETAKKLCVGCSVDGKTTPRTADGHPDLSGFWGGVAAAPAAAAGCRQEEETISK